MCSNTPHCWLKSQSSFIYKGMRFQTQVNHSDLSERSSSVFISPWLYRWILFFIFSFAGFLMSFWEGRASSSETERCWILFLDINESVLTLPIRFSLCILPWLYLPRVSYNIDWLKPLAQQSSHPCTSVPMVQLHSTGQLPYKSRRGAESAWRFCDVETTLSFSWRESLGECDKLGSPTLRKVTWDWLHSQGSSSLGTLGSTSGLYISSSSVGRLRPGL